MTAETKCDHCAAAEATKRCAKCREATYCSQECQRAAWSQHKKVCGSGESATVQQPSPSSKILTGVRESCSSVASVASEVRIDADAIAKFVESMDCSAVKESAQGSKTCFPLQFDSLEDEVNFLSVFHLLNIGSGFREELHAANGASAHDTVVRGLIGLRLSNRPLDAQGLSTFNAEVIKNSFDVEEKVMKVLPGFPAEISSEGPLAGFVHALIKLAKGAGETLKLSRHKSLGEFVIRSLEKQPCCAADLVSSLVDRFPGFADAAVYSHTSNDTATHGIDVAFHKKAQVLVVELWRRFREEQPKLFAFKDIADVTVGADSVVPALLRQLGILSLEAPLAEAIENKEPLSANAEIALRAAAVHACEKIVEAANCEYKEITPCELDAYFWGVIGKQEEFSDLACHVRTDTLHY